MAETAYETFVWEIARRLHYEVTPLGTSDAHWRMTCKWYRSLALAVLDEIAHSEVSDLIVSLALSQAGHLGESDDETVQRILAHLGPDDKELEEAKQSAGLLPDE